MPKLTVAVKYSTSMNKKKSSVLYPNIGDKKSMVKDATPAKNPYLYLLSITFTLYLYAIKPPAAYNHAEFQETYSSPRYCHVSDASKTAIVASIPAIYVYSFGGLLLSYSLGPVSYTHLTLPTIYSV